MNSETTRRQWLAVSIVVFCSLGFSQAVQEEPSNSPFIDAIEHRQLVEARRILRSKPFLNVRNNLGVTPLVAAICSRSGKFIEELLLAGADPNFATGNGATPLMSAASKNDLEVASMLLKRRASVDARDIHGETALMIASGNGADGKLVKLLLDAGADPNAKDQYGDRPLNFAARFGGRAEANSLLNAGADRSAKDASGETAEEIACQFGDNNVCELLREARGFK